MFFMSRPLQNHFYLSNSFSRDNNVLFEFHHSYFLVKDHHVKNTILIGPSKAGLYCLPSASSCSYSPSVQLAEHASTKCWHRRLGHPHLRFLRHIITANHLPCSSSTFKSLCSACQIGKSCRLPLSITNNYSRSILDACLMMYRVLI